MRGDEMIELHEEQVTVPVNGVTDTLGLRMLQLV